MFETLTLAAIPPGDEALRPLVRELADGAIAGMPLDRRARSWSGFDPQFSRRLGEAGLLGLTLPKRYGGGGRGPLRRRGAGPRLVGLASQRSPGCRPRWMTRWKTRPKP